MVKDSRIDMRVEPDTRQDWDEFAALYESPEAALVDLLRVASEFPQLPNRPKEWEG